MAKFMKKTFAMMLVLCMLVGMLPVQALAEEGTEDVTLIDASIITGETTPMVVVSFEPIEQSQITTEETFEQNYGSYDEEVSIDVTVSESTATETDEEGNTVVTDTTVTVIEGTVGEGTLTGEETYTETTITNPDGYDIGRNWVIDGTENFEYSKEDLPAVEQPDVTVELIPGEQTEASVEISTTVTGNAPEGDDDTSYDYTTTIESERTVTAETSDVIFSVNDADDGLVDKQASGLIGLAPVYDEDDDVVYKSNGKIDDTHGKDGLFDRNYMSANSKWTDTENWDMPEGADFRYIGTGEHSKYYVGFVNIVYQKDENGNTVYDENGEPVIERLLNSAGGDILINGQPATELLAPEDYDGYSGSRASTFMLMDKDGNRVFGYCCDLETGTNDGTWYTFSNLEDSEYYASEESEAHIRSIVMNGYWGTSDVQKEDGSYELGSLESIKANLKAAIANGEISSTIQVPVRNVNANGNVAKDDDGNVIYVEMDVLDFIDGLTEGEALLATQAAIWSYSNGHQNAINGEDGAMVLTPDWYRNHQIGYSSTEKEHLSDEGGARVEFLYNWLLGLETEEESTIIINEKNFVEDLSLTVHDKVEGHANNLDDNQTNDVYNTDLNFKLAFIPGANDDLLVQISYTDLDGNTVNVVRRLAGENSEGQYYEDILPEEDGSYVLKGLKLSENEDFNFDLRLEGTQYLEQGVYVYEAIGGRDVSQTFVGIAEGERNVDVSLGVTIKFDVDENNRVVAQRRWHDEQDPVNDPPARYRYTPGETTIEEEPVPLADVPQTGDNSVLWFALIALAGCGLCILNLSDKKCKA